MAAAPSTYDPSTDVGKVRLYIQDTEMANAKFVDAEINVFITDAGGGKLHAAAGLTLLAWAASLGREDEDVSVGSWSGDRRDVAKKMRDLADDYFKIDNFELDRQPAPVLVTAITDWTPEITVRRELTEDD